MSDLKTRISVELENIDLILAELPQAKDLPGLSRLELAGTAALVHNFYSGIESIIKQILLSKDVSVAEGGSWHKELIETAAKNGLISESTRNALGQYLSFRHFFVHAYALELYADRMEPLVGGVVPLYDSFKKDISPFLI